MDRNRATEINREKKTIVVCEKCYQKLSIPRRKRKLRVTCPICHNEFDYRYYGFGLSSGSKIPALVGLSGSLVAILIIELIIASRILSTVSCLLSTTLLMGVFNACLDATMRAAPGFLSKERDMLHEDLAIGASGGFLSGMLSGLIAQLIFSGIQVYTSQSPRLCLLAETLHFDTSMGRNILARSVGWSAYAVIQVLVGSFTQHKLTDVKSRLMGGAAGGSVAGFLFEITSTLTGLGRGTIARFFSLSVMGSVIGVVTFQFRRIAPRQRQIRGKNHITIKEILAGPGLFFLGLILFIAGILLYGGNTTGVFPTFPFAGFVTGTIGFAIMGAALKRNW